MCFQIGRSPLKMACGVRGYFRLGGNLRLVAERISTTVVVAMNASLRNQFLYVACQHGAEKVLKQAFCEPIGTFRLAYSGKGFLTFKAPFAIPAWSRALPDHPLVRSRGLVLGRVEGTDSAPMVEEILKDFAALDWQVIHVWQRDIAQPGWNGFEPGQSQLAISIAERIRDELKKRGDHRPVLANGLEYESVPTTSALWTPTAPTIVHDLPPEPEAFAGLTSSHVDPVEKSDQAEQLDGTADTIRAAVDPKTPKERVSRILEIIIDEPQRWWIASKVAQQDFDFWPGGVPELYQPEEVISRAYFKIAEAFAWSGLKIRPGERIVEIGSAPGGACQWLLDAGAKVTGLDPADMDEGLLAHPNFTHWRSRSLQVKRRAFRDFRILVCDANVTPNYTLDTVEAIVTYPTSRFRALVLTMKMPDWDHARLIADHLERVRSWGYEHVEARQLAHNRREYCLVAKGRIRSQLESSPGIAASSPGIAASSPGIAASSPGIAASPPGISTAIPAAIAPPMPMPDASSISQDAIPEDTVPSLDGHDINLEDDSELPEL
jgi:23S rRNA (cytidine2498-2'-O)-methyltransferase